MSKILTKQNEQIPLIGMKPKIQIKFKKTHPDAVLPTQSIDDVGWDFSSVEDVVIEPFTSKLVPTGLVLAEPPKVRVYPQIEGRSGLALKNSVFPLGGVLDRSYRGEIGVILYNGSNNPYEVKKNDKVAQMVFLFCLSNTDDLDVELTEAEEIQESNRADKGFGSSGR